MRLAAAKAAAGNRRNNNRFNEDDAFGNGSIRDEMPAY